MMTTTTNDPRLLAPQCRDLKPVQTVHKNDWFAVRRRGSYYTVEPRRKQVTVLPIVEKRAAVMVWARRPIIADVCLELPAGGTQDGETPVEAAARELAEETGITIDDLDRFEAQPPLCITPRRPCFPHVYQVDLSQREFDQRGRHDGEVEGVQCMDFGNIFQAIVQGSLYVSLPIAILTRYVLSNSNTLRVDL